MMIDNKSNHAAPQRFTAKNYHLKAGDMVQVLPVDEIRKSLDENNQTDGLSFMPEMGKYCNTKRKILRRVKFLFDEHAWKMKKIKNIVILERVICNGEDKLSEEGGQMAVDLKFGTLDDFNPESVAQQVPEMNKLLQLRTALQALKGPLGNVPDFRKKLQSLLDDVAAREKLLQELGVSGEEESEEES